MKILEQATFSKGVSMKKQCFILLLISISFGSARAQWPELTPDVRDTIQEHKAEMFRYRQIQLTETMQTLNQEQYDVLYYDIDLLIDPDQRTVSGKVGLRARVAKGFMDRMEVDLHDNMTVNLITVFGDTASFTHQNDLVDIELGNMYSREDIVEAEIEYSGTPSGGGEDYFRFTYHDGKPMIWSLSEPFGSRNWWPCKDQPSDKADSVDIRVTVPKGMIVASNGSLREVTDNGDTETYWWHESYPIVTYLVSIAIYEYYTYSDYYKYSPTDSMEIQFYVFPDHLYNLQTNYAKTKNMLEIFSNLFGEYPFINEKYGHAEFTWSGGMEHQTCTSLGGWGESLIAHELAHQWWGNMITCRDFHHIWLNEGFATYSEALYKEQESGQSAYFSDINGNKFFGGGTIYVPDVLDVSRIFHGGLSYNKGSWVLHMLRHVVGDATFFDILQAYYDSQFQHGTAVTEDFQAVCEAVSGMELGWYFQEWIYGEYYPQYTYCWSSVDRGGNYEVTLTIDQTQTNTGVFTMPIDVTFSAIGNEETCVAFNDQQSQTFEFNLNFEPSSVQLDKDGWILKSVNERSIRLRSPDGGERWGIGETKTITWSSSQTSGTVGIEYSTNAGSNWQFVIASTPDDRSYVWTVPNTPSTTCLVRIYDTNFTICRDQSDDTFTICDPPHVDFSSGQIQIEDYTCSVQFTDLSTGPVTEWSWDFGDGKTSNEQNPSHTFNCGNTYTVSLTASGSCGSYVETKNDYISCECPCQIELTSPNGDEIWCAGEAEDITWATGETGESLKVELSTDNGLNWMSISDDTPDDGSHSWITPDVSSTSCLIRLYIISDPECSDTCDNPFQICHCGAIEITTENMTTGTYGCPYSDTVDAAGGCLPHSWSIFSGRLPEGLILDSSSGTISGSPNEVGDFDFTVLVSDVFGTNGQRNFSIQVGDYDNAKGDANGDCSVNILDVMSVINIILELETPTEEARWRADCNGPTGLCDGDGEIDIIDALKIITLILGLDECP